MNPQPENQEPATPPVEAAAPVAATPAPESAKAPSKKNKTLLTAIIAIVVVVVVVIGVWFAFFRVTKADYRQAATALNEMSSTYNDLSSDISRITSSRGDSEQLKSDLATYKKQSAEFSKERALRDGDVKQKYDAAAAQNKKFIAFVESFAESADVLQKVGEECSSSNTSSISRADAGQILSSFDAATSKCVDSLKEMAKSKNEPIAKYAKSLLEGYDTLRAAVVKLQEATTAGNSSARLSAAREVSSAARQISSVSSRELRSALNDVEVNDQMNALSKVLTEKANK